jgi:hypothetical protein
MQLGRVYRRKATNRRNKIKERERRKDAGNLAVKYRLVKKLLFSSEI